MPNEDTRPDPPSSLWRSSELAERWQKDVERRREDLTEATQRMLEAARLKPGDRVLDVAAGTGDQSMVAARIVGPGGSILATDISAKMLDRAARVAEQEGLTNIITRVMDAEDLDLEENAFDAVICRLGLMFLPHFQQALTGIRRVLKPGGRLSALVWSAPENNPLFSLPLAILSKHAKGASSPLPNPFALAYPAVFERALTEAGFCEVTTHPIPFQSHYASLDALLHSAASMVSADVMGQLSPKEQQHLWGAVRQALSQFEGSHGLVAPAELLLGAGIKSDGQEELS